MVTFLQPCVGIGVGILYGKNMITKYYEISYFGSKAIFI